MAVMAQGPDRRLVALGSTPGRITGGSPASGLYHPQPGTRPAGRPPPRQRGQSRPRPAPPPQGLRALANKTAMCVCSTCRLQPCASARHAGYRPVRLLDTAHDHGPALEARREASGMLDSSPSRDRGGGARWIGCIYSPIAWLPPSYEPGASDGVASAVWQRGLLALGHFGSTMRPRP